MKTRKWRNRLLLIMVAIGIVSAFVGARKVAAEHIMKQSGRETVPTFNCLDCHRGPKTPHFFDRPDPEDHPKPSAVCLSPSGENLYVISEGNGEVLSLRCQDLSVEKSLILPGHLRGLALDSSGETLAVTCSYDNLLYLIETRDLSVVTTIPVGKHPIGVVWGEGDRFAYVANSGSDDLSIVDVDAGLETKRLTMNRRPWSLALEPGGTTLLVTHQLAKVTLAEDLPLCELTVVDTGRHIVTDRIQLPSTHLAHGIEFSPDGSFALVACVLVRNRVPITQVARSWLMNAALAVVRLDADEPAVLVPLDSFTRCHADPTDVVVSPDGTRAFVASGGNDRVVTVDVSALMDVVRSEVGGQDGAPLVDSLGLSPRYVIDEIATGVQPHSLAVSRDGGELFVAERLSDSIARIDTETGTVLARHQRPRPIPETREHEGERVFASAAMAFQNQFSCQSCHPNASSDGLSYDFEIDGLGQNVLKNRDLRGLSGTHPFKWNGKNRTLHDQCGRRFAMVLTRTEPFSDEDLDALVTYLESLPPPSPRPSEIAATESIQRGEELFFRTHTNDGVEIAYGNRCSTCHPPPFFTNHMKFDLGTAGPLDTVHEFDPPHLLGVIENAPYLHDGSSKTLEELWTVLNPEDHHGFSKDWTKQQLNDLVEYLKTL